MGSKERHHECRGGLGLLALTLPRATLSKVDNRSTALWVRNLNSEGFERVERENVDMEAFLVGLRLFSLAASCHRPQ